LPGKADTSEEERIYYNASEITYIENDLKFYQEKIRCLKNKQIHSISDIQSLKSTLFNERKKIGDLNHKINDLIKKNRKGRSTLQSVQEKYGLLKERHDYLERLVTTYRSRRAVRAADAIWKVYYFLERHLIRILGQKNNKKAELVESKPKNLKNIKIAVILDEFSYNSFKYEFNAITFEPSNWLEIFEKEKPDLFLCESAWIGVDSERKPWIGKINFHVNSKKENRGVLLDIIEYCNENGITTIFWSKEDPTNFHQFFDTALKFHHIFTTAEECIPRYKDHGHESVHCLMFAAQPKLFNPIEKQERSDDIIFAGSWYSHFTQRSNEMTEIFDNILDSGFKLKIYDRTYHMLKDNPNRLYPSKYGEFINPPVPHDQVEKIYKESKYSLNINTVTDSNTMFARRVFELMLCDTLVLSNYSEGVDNLFGDDVVFVDKDKIDLSGSEEKRINSFYNVLENHTYSNRFKQILDTINYEYILDDDAVTIYYVVNNQSEIEDVLEHYKSINYDSKKLVLLSSSKIPGRLIKNIHQKYSNEEVAVQSLNHILYGRWSITNFIHKLLIGGELQNPDKRFLNDTAYFIFADLQLDDDFIKKAVLHYSYIGPETGIAKGNKFEFKKVKDIKNVLLSNENFTKAFNNLFKDNSMEFPVYTIKI